MLTVPADLLKRLQQHGQEHVLAAWPGLTENERRSLLEQLQALDLDLLGRLFAERNHKFPVPASERIAPVPVVRLDADVEEARQRGEQALRRGEVAALMVAGGQGSRLGFDQPKGMYPIAPVTGKSLFHVHAEKVLALQRRYRRSIPFLILTSPATHEATESFFGRHGYFGLPREDVYLFPQGTMPAVDLETGKLLFEERGKLFASPNGHGGTLTALAGSGLLDRLRQRGIRQLFYFQVDNLLVKVADAVFLGHHLTGGTEVSLKIVAKEGPADRLGNVVLVDGRCTIIEYSDLPEELGRQTDERGQLRIWAGSPAIHIFALDFLERVTRGGVQIPFHIARKKVPCVNDQGVHVVPDHENALKFEMFIFDVLPLAERFVVVETSRREEFVPLKNASGPDSPETVRQALSNLAADWLEHAGIVVPRRDNADTGYPLEISPLFALDAQELAGKVDRSLKVEGPLYLGPV
jgi:UDP-N-acetylglucosamine/UDP-N-acetylgalactosamine diphosphorylase